jgi:hypothetical protein
VFRDGRDLALNIQRPVYPGLLRDAGEVLPHHRFFEAKGQANLFASVVLADQLHDLSLAWSQPPSK